MVRAKMPGMLRTRTLHIVKRIVEFSVPKFETLALMHAQKIATNTIKCLILGSKSVRAGISSFVRVI